MILEVCLNKQFNNALIEAQIKGEGNFLNTNYTLGELKTISKNIRSLYIKISTATDKKNNDVAFIEVLERDIPYLALRNRMLESKLGRSMPHRFVCSIAYKASLVYIEKINSFTALKEDDFKDLLGDYSYEDLCDQVLCLAFKRLVKNE